MNWIADTIDSHRRIICTLIVLLTAVALVGIHRLDFSMNPASDVRGDDTDWRLLREFYQEYDPEGQACIVLLRTDKLFTPKALGVITKFMPFLRSFSSKETVLFKEPLLWIEAKMELKD